MPAVSELGLQLPVIQTTEAGPRKPMLNNVMLIEPRNGYYTGFQDLVRTEPLGLEYIAGALVSNDPNAPRYVNDVQIHDDRIQPGGWVDKIRQTPPDLVGIRCNYTADVKTVQNLVRQVRHEVGKDVPIIVGGHHISLRPEDIFIPEADAVVVGEGERTIRNAVGRWAQDHSFENVKNIWYRDHDNTWKGNVDPTPEKLSTGVEFNSAEMDERPTPRRDLVAQYRGGYYFLYYPGPYSLETARGCQFRCNFCTIPQFHGGDYRVESPDRTVQEMLSLPEDAKYLNFVDDLAFRKYRRRESDGISYTEIDPGRDMASELLRLGQEGRFRFWAQIRADNVWPKDEAERAKAQETVLMLRDCGLDMVLIGLESFDPAELKRVNKGSTVEQNINAINFLRENGIKIWGAQIIFPEWDIEDFDRLIQINQQLGIECPQFTIYTPLPGSTLHKEVQAKGLLKTNDPSKFDFFHFVQDTRLPEEEMYRQIARGYRQTSAFAKKPDGRLLNPSQAKRQYRSMQRDIAEGRTNEAAIRAFTQRFADLQNENVHLEHLMRVRETEVTGTGNQDSRIATLAGNALAQGGQESITLDLDKPFNIG